MNPIFRTGRRALLVIGSDPFESQNSTKFVREVSPRSLRTYSLFKFNARGDVGHLAIKGCDCHISARPQRGVEEFSGNGVRRARQVHERNKTMSLTTAEGRIESN